jgi:hypothetical protein
MARIASGEARQQEVWRRDVEHEVQTAVTQQRTQALTADLERSINPPLPEPEREIVYMSGDELRSPNLGDRGGCTDIVVYSSRKRLASCGHSTSRLS